MRTFFGTDFVEPSFSVNVNCMPCVALSTRPGHQQSGPDSVEAVARHGELRCDFQVSCSPPALWRV
jgi:hypothetical protein